MTKLYDGDAIWSEMGEIAECLTSTLQTRLMEKYSGLVQDRDSYKREMERIQAAYNNLVMRQSVSINETIIDKKELEELNRDSETIKGLCKLFNCGNRYELVAHLTQYGEKYFNNQGAKDER